MRQKQLIAVLAFVIAMPIAAAYADTTSTTTPTDCGSAPTRQAVGATADQMTAFRTAMQTYRQCTMTNRQNQHAVIKTDQQNLNNQRQTLQGDKQQLNQDRCTIINQRITDRLNNFQSKQNGDSTIFGNAYGRLNNIQTRLKSDNLDTSKLVTDLATLKTKIDKVNSDYANFISGLKDTESFTCGQSQGQFMGKLGAARGILMSVRQDRLDVRGYIVNTIIPDIKALRQQLQKKEGTTNPDAGTTTTPANNQ